MSEIKTIIEAVKSVIAAKNVSAVISEYPFDGKKRLKRPLVTVGLKNGSGVSSGFAEYMGLKYDRDTDTSREVFGKRVDITLKIGIFSPREDECGAGACIDIYEEITGALMELPSGIKVREFSCGETDYDMVVNLFHCEAELSLTVFLYAEQTETGEFTDFTVRGVLD